MFVFAKRMIRDKWKPFFIYAISTVGLLEMYVALFPAIQKQASQFDQMLKTFPSEIFKAMNMDVNSLSFGKFESYLSSEYMSFLWPILAIVFAISLANYVVVNEIEKGTIETLMSLPAKRINIFLERYATGLLILIVFCAISLFAAIPLAEMHGVKYVFENYLTASVGSVLFIWAVYSLAILFSTIFSEKGKASMVTSGILVLMYVLSIISALNNDLTNLQYFSFFHYFNGGDLLANNIYPEHILLALGGSAVVLTTLSVVYFKRRDLSV